MYVSVLRNILHVCEFLFHYFIYVTPTYMYALMHLVCNLSSVLSSGIPYVVHVMYVLTYHCVMYTAIIQGVIHGSSRLQPCDTILSYYYVYIHVIYVTCTVIHPYSQHVTCYMSADFTWGNKLLHHAHDAIR